MNEFPQLEGRLVFHDLDNTIFRPFREEFGVSGKDRPAFLTSQLYQRISILSSIINGIITQHSQLLSQLPKHSICNKLHSLYLAPFPIARLPRPRSEPVSRKRGMGE
jgi:hypothetical protein